MPLPVTKSVKIALTVKRVLDPSLTSPLSRTARTAVLANLPLLELLTALTAPMAAMLRLAPRLALTAPTVMRVTVLLPMFATAKLPLALSALLVLLPSLVPPVAQTALRATTALLALGSALLALLEPRVRMEQLFADLRPLLASLVLLASTLLKAQSHAPLVERVPTALVVLVLLLAPTALLVSKVLPLMSLVALMS
jgi:hypothetical protein